MSCCVWISIFTLLFTHVVQADGKPIVGGRTWIRIGVNERDIEGPFKARVDTGAKTISIDAIDFDTSSLKVGQTFSFSIVTRREKVGNQWVVKDKKECNGKLKSVSRVNGNDRPVIEVWLKWRNESAKRFLANLASRNRKHRVLLGRNWISGKLVDVDKKMEKKFAVNGERFSDIRQGRLGSCSILAALASASNSGIKFKDRVKNIQNDSYRVRYYSGSSGKIRETDVNLANGRTEDDPKVFIGGREEWWPVIMQRCFLHSMASTKRDRTNGSNAVAFLSGRPVDRLLTKKISVETLRVELQKSIKKKHVCIIAQTKAKSKRKMNPKCSPMLLSHHAYALLDADDEFVTLYNPHGVDIEHGSSHIVDGRFRDGFSDNNGDDPHDGLLRLHWDVFHANMKAIYVSVVKPISVTETGN